MYHRALEGREGRGSRGGGGRGGEGGYLMFNLQQYKGGEAHVLIL